MEKLQLNKNLISQARTFIYIIKYFIFIFFMKYYNQVRLVNKIIVYFSCFISLITTKKLLSRVFYKVSLKVVCIGLEKG